MGKTKKIIILGTAGNSIDILDTINELNNNAKESLYSCIGFLDDDTLKLGKEYLGVKVLGSLSHAKDFEDAYFINGIGNDSNFWGKETIIGQTNIHLERFVTLCHPTSSVSKTASLGFGTMVFQNVTIASNAKIGNHAMIFPNSVISHENIIGDYTHVTGGVCISGRVTIGRSCYFGTNSSVIGDVIIGDYSLIGMGSVILKDVPENSVFVGNPAKFLRKTR